MDTSPETLGPDTITPGDTLSYDDTVPYEEQLPTEEEKKAAASLAGRIGTAKLYLLSETSVARVGKRKFAGEESENGGNADGDIEMEDDVSYRTNAVLLHGPPIAHLPTARLFAYTKHFNVEPMGLEWIDDTTCVLVFPSKTLARTAYTNLQKSSSEEPDTDNFVNAHPIPVALWPPEERIGASLGTGRGLKGVIRMRWALEGDVKKKDARKQSEFYRKHGKMAGKEMYGGEDVPHAAKRRRGNEGEEDGRAAALDAEAQKAQLDAELDQFLAEDGSAEEEPSRPSSPPSKMRSDYIAADGRTLLERTSRPDLASRITAPLPRRARGRGAVNGNASGDDLGSRISTQRARSPRRGGRREDRGPRRGGEPRKAVTQQDLDDELDAFLKGQS